MTVSSCTAFGMLLGSIGLRAKDFFFAANLAYFLMLLFCGVNIPLDQLPGWMSAISRCLPLTHGIAAAREVAAGASLGDVAGLVWTELAVGACYAVAGFLLFRVLERESRRTAVLDVYLAGEGSHPNRRPGYPVGPEVERGRGNVRDGAHGSVLLGGRRATRSADRGARGLLPACACRRRACPSPCAHACARFPPR